jgi:hypothetical protein
MMLLMTLGSLIFVGQPNAEALFAERLWAYDIYYTVTVRFHFQSHLLADERIVLDPLPEGVRRPERASHFRCRRNKSIVRLERLVDGQVVTTTLFYDGVRRDYDAATKSFVVNDKAISYADDRRCYEEYRHAYWGRTTIPMLYSHRAKKGFPVAIEAREGMVDLSMAPGDGSSFELGKYKVVVTYDPQKALALRTLKVLQEHGDGFQEVREVTDFLKVSDDLFVPIRARTRVYGKQADMLYNQLANEYELQVDAARSRWNVRFNSDELKALEIPAGAEVVDMISKQKYVTGASAPADHLDKLAENAVNIQKFFSLPAPAPARSRLTLSLAVACFVVLMLVVALRIRRRWKPA